RLVDVEEGLSRRAVCPEPGLRSPAAGHGEKGESAPEERGPASGIEEGLATEQQPEDVRERCHQQKPYREVHQEWVELAANHRGILPGGPGGGKSTVGMSRDHD